MKGRGERGPCSQVHTLGAGAGGGDSDLLWRPRCPNPGPHVGSWRPVAGGARLGVGAWGQGLRGAPAPQPAWGQDGGWSCLFWTRGGLSQGKDAGGCFSVVTATGAQRAAPALSPLTLGAASPGRAACASSPGCGPALSGSPTRPVPHEPPCAWGPALPATSKFTGSLVRVSGAQSADLGRARQGRPEARCVGRVPGRLPLLPAVRQRQGEEAVAAEERCVRSGREGLPVRGVGPVGLGAGSVSQLLAAARRGCCGGRR